MASMFPCGKDLERALFTCRVCLPLRNIIDDSHSNCYKKRMSPKQILAIRKALGMTQSQLADRIAAHRVSVARWETGRNGPKGAYLKALNELAAKIKTKR